MSQLENLEAMEEDDDDEEEDIGTPIASLLFDFLTDSRSSIYASIWSGLTIALVLARIMELSLESCSGPNQYDQRPKDMSDFKFLLDKNQYWNLYIAIMVPLIIDGFARLLFLLLILWESEHHPIYEKFRGDLMEVFLFCTDVIGLIPFFSQAAYYQPHHSSPTNAGEVVLSILELFLTGRIFRVLRKYPAIQAITRALSRAAEHLILPLFFFFIFNITAGVFFYFSQPCYNVNTCAWKNLFDATFYSIVSMTTTGYGNQVPYFEAARFVACLVMMFGALFLSMPLAIIGNEYDRAWNEVKEEHRILEEQKAMAEGSRINSSFAEEVSGERRVSISKGSFVMGKPNHELTMDEKKKLLCHQPVMTILEQIHRILQRLYDDYRNNRHHIPHSTVIALCELKAWVPIFCLNIEQTVVLMTTISSQEFLANMTEMVVENINSSVPTSHGAFGGGAPFGGRPFQTPSGGATGGNSDILHRLQEFKRGNLMDGGMTDDMGGSYHSSQEGSERSDRSEYRNKREIDNGEDDDDDENFSNFSFSDVEGSDADSNDKGWKPSQMLTTSSKKDINQENNANNQINHKRHNSGDHNGNRAEKKREEIQKMIGSPTKFSKVAPLEINTTEKEVTIAAPATTFRVIDRDDDDSDYEIDEPTLWETFWGIFGYRRPTARNRTFTQDFTDRMQRAKADPDNLRNRIWILLEDPSSSKEARALQVLLIVLISISIFSLFTQTVTKLTLYGESTKICGELVNVYCSDKFNAVLDPACYAHYANGTISPHRLRFHCDEMDCFGYGANFGAAHSYLNCSSASSTPFQDQESLRSHYGLPTLLFSRLKMHRSHDVCTRIECMDNSDSYFDARSWWIGIEFIMNIIFSIEIILRISVADSFMAYWKDKMNLMDLLAIFPFYSEMFSAAAKGGFSNINFSILASSPEEMFLVYVRALKVFRLIKLSRHFRASKVLLETARRVVFQIFGMIAFLAFLVLLFAIILYQLEKGHGCYVDDVGCLTAESIDYVAQPGQFVWVNKEGALSGFPNVFYGVWFSFVTITTVGYGDIVPITQGGMTIGIFLMIAGQFYMAMPLTATATTFYQVHEQYEEHSHVLTLAQAASLEESKTNRGLSKTKEAMLDPQLQSNVRQLVRHLRSEEHVLTSIVEDIQSSSFSMFDEEILDQERRSLKAHGSGSRNDKRHTNSTVMKAAQLKHRIAALCKDLEERIHEGENYVIDALMKYQDLLTGKIFEQAGQK